MSGHSSDNDDTGFLVVMDDIGMNLVREYDYIGFRFSPLEGKVYLLGSNDNCAIWCAFDSFLYKRVDK